MVHSYNSCSSWGALLFASLGAMRRQWLLLFNPRNSVLNFWTMPFRYVGKDASVYCHHTFFSCGCVRVILMFNTFHFLSWALSVYTIGYTLLGCRYFIFPSIPSGFFLSHNISPFILYIFNICIYGWLVGFIRSIRCYIQTSHMLDKYPSIKPHLFLLISSIYIGLFFTGSGLNQISARSCSLSEQELMCISFSICT